MSRKIHSVEELEIMAYLDGELSRERAAGLAAHLEQCDECQRVVADLRGVSHELAGWQVELPDLQITPRIAVALEDYERAQESAPVRRRSGLTSFLRRHPRWVWSIASVAVMVLVIAVNLPNLMMSRRRDLFMPLGSPHPSSLPQKTADQSSYVYSDSTTRQFTEDGTLGGLVAHQHVTAIQEPTKAQAEHEIRIPTGPMIVRTAQLTLTTSEFDRARTSLEEILKRHNGYMGQLGVTGAADTARTLEAVLRVPAGQLDAALAELKGLGHVDSESQKGDEVSQQYVDLQARLQNARNTEQRLTEILRQRTGKLSDVLAVEQEIASVREQIESMEAEKKTLEKQVSFSTVTMKINEDYKQPVRVVPDSTSKRIRNAAVAGYEMMVAGVINLLLFLFSWGPSLLLWGLILFFPARWLWKRRRNNLF